MTREMKNACLKAAAKFGIGLSVVLALIGIRLVTVTPQGLESGIRDLDRLDSKIAAELESKDSGATRAERGSADSIVSRLGAGLREQLPGSGSRSHDDGGLVSCRTGGSTQFMRADDCAMRGGESTVIPPDR